MAGTTFAIMFFGLLTYLYGGQIADKAINPDDIKSIIDVIGGKFNTALRDIEIAGTSTVPVTESIDLNTIPDTPPE